MNAQAEHSSLEVYLQSVLTSEQLVRPLIVNFNHWQFVQQIATEAALTLHDMGSAVEFAFWAENTPIRDIAYSTSNRVAKLLRSPSREHQIIRALVASGVPNSAFKHPPIKHWKPAEPLHLPKELNRSNIREMRYRGADLGRAILQVHPDLNTPIADSHLWPRKWVTTAAKSFAFVYDQITQLIQQDKITSVFVYNGRFLHDRAAAAAAQQAGLPILNFDIGGAVTGFDLTIDPTHDWSKLQSRMLTLYRDWDTSERDEIGASWFNQRINHTDLQNRAYTDAQQVGLSIEVPQHKKLVAFFSSSGDEIVELDLEWDQYFGDQGGALKALGRECSSRDDIYFVVRTHPHKRRKPKLDVQQWHEIVSQVGPDVHLDEFSEIDSYTLMREADIVVTYGSTTGIEAAFAGRPVIVMGPSAYDELGAVHRVTSQVELRQALSNPVSGEIEGSLAFGLMMQRRGFNYSRVINDDGEFAVDGVKISDSNDYVLHLTNLLSKINHRKLTR